MSISKSQQYKELMLSFELIQTEEDNKAGIININAYGDVFGESKSCSATYNLSKVEMYKNGDYNEIINLLKDNENKKIRVIFKMKNGKAKDFKIDLSSLVSLYDDDRFSKLDLLAWGLNDRRNENNKINRENLFNNKIILSVDEKDKKYANICMYIFSILVLLLNILFLIGESSLVIISFPSSIIIAMILFSYINNPKIEIENSVITKTNLFNKKKEIGHVSEITSFSEDIFQDTVLNNNEKIFSFNLHGRDDNSFFL